MQVLPKPELHGIFMTAIPGQSDMLTGMHVKCKFFIKVAFDCNY